MRLLAINSVNYGSTGTIMKEIAISSNFEFLLAVEASRSCKKKLAENQILIGNRLCRYLSLQLNRLFGLCGCFNWITTLVFLAKVKKFNPDVIHLHNLHNSYINLSFLFKFLRNNKIPVVWTLHDCWAFTGHCAHFAMAKCNKWKNGCSKCPSFREYPQGYIDNSKFMWNLKKKWFIGVEKMTLIVPSHWLSDMVRQSFLKNYPVKLISNGIDLSVFKPMNSDFRYRYRIESNQKILLGVAFGWGIRKGLDVFIELFKRLDQREYRIVLVGTDSVVDKQLPEGIISIHCTQNQRELAEIYSAADLFVNPTREEVLGLVNLEALACGTPGITFKAGGSPECYDKTCGCVVDCNDVNALEKEIVRICSEQPYTKDACVKRALLFDQNCRFDEYIELYKNNEL